MAGAAGGVPQARIKRVLAELIESLQALHEQGHVGGNIGIHAIGLDETGCAHLAPSASPPETGYAPPELYDVELQWPRGPWTDIYGLSAVAHTLIVGKRPPAAIERMALDVYLPLAERNLPGYEPAFLQAIDAGLALDPKARPQTLESYAQRLGLRQPPQSNAAARSAPPPRRAASMQSIDARMHDISLRVAQRRAAARIGAPLRRAWLPTVLAAALISGVGVYWWGRMSSAEDLFVATVVPPTSPAFDYDNLPPTGALSPQMPAPAPSAPVEERAAHTGTAASWSPAATPVTQEIVPEARAVPDALLTPAPVHAPPPVARPEPALALAAPTASVTPVQSAAKSGRAATGAGPARVTVKLDIQPWGEIWTDGVRHGASPPLRELQLEPGRHVITVRNADLPPYHATLTVREGHPAVITHFFE